MNIKTKRHLIMGIALLGAIGAGYVIVVSVFTPPDTTVPEVFVTNPQQETKPSSAATHANNFAQLPSRRRSELEHHSRTKDELNEFKALKEELNQLRAELARLSRENATLALQLQEISSSDQLMESEDTALTAERQSEQAEIEALAQLDTLETTVQAEPLDSEWVPQAQDALMNAFASEELKGIDLLSADCRSTLCRLEIGLDNPEEAQESLSKLSLLAPWPGEGFFSYDNDDSQKAVVYLAREGYPLRSDITAE